MHKLSRCLLSAASLLSSLPHPPSMSGWLHLHFSCHARAIGFRPAVSLLQVFHISALQLLIHKNGKSEEATKREVKPTDWRTLYSRKHLSVRNASQKQAHHPLLVFENLLHRRRKQNCVYPCSLQLISPHASMEVLAAVWGGRTEGWNTPLTADQRWYGLLEGRLCVCPLCGVDLI